MKHLKTGFAASVVAAIATGCGQPAASSADAETSQPIAVVNASQTSGSSERPAPSAAAAALEWPGFRGPGQQGRGSGRPALKWSEGENIAWKTKIPGSGSSSPIVAFGRVFVTSHEGYGESERDPGDMSRLSLMLHRLDLGTGRIDWTSRVKPRLPVAEYRKRMLHHGYATSTPVTDGKRVYCFFGNTGVRAFQFDGSLAWEADVGSAVHGWGSASSPVLHKDLLILNAYSESKALVALRKDTGKEAWRTEGLNETWSSPHVVRLPDGSAELVMAHFGEIVGYDPESGQRLWTCDGPKWYSVGGLISQDGVIYGTYGKGYQATFAVRAGGRGDVTDTHLLWEARKGSNVSSPVLHDGRLYLAHEQTGVAYCFDAATGEVIYEERLPYRIGEFYASPVLADGRIYYTSRRRGVAVIAAKPSLEAVALNPPLDESLWNASPALAGDRILLRSSRALYCVTPAD